MRAQTLADQLADPGGPAACRVEAAGITHASLSPWRCLNGKRLASNPRCKTSLTAVVTHEPLGETKGQARWTFNRTGQTHQIRQQFQVGRACVGVSATSWQHCAAEKLLTCAWQLASACCFTPAALVAKKVRLREAPVDFETAIHNVLTNCAWAHADTLFSDANCGSRSLWPRDLALVGIVADVRGRDATRKRPSLHHRIATELCAPKNSILIVVLIAMVHQMTRTKSNCSGKRASCHRERMQT